MHGPSLLGADIPHSGCTICAARDAASLTRSNRIVSEDGMTTNVPAGFAPFAKSSPFLDLIGPLYAKTDEGALG